MRIAFIRHGESEANVAGILSSSPNEAFRLTDKGRAQVKDLSKHIPLDVDCVYVSPLQRTRETADILFHDRQATGLQLRIDDRIAEIDYGRYSGQPNNTELDLVRKAQVAGDYQVKFGDFGENKFKIFTRLYDFLIDILETYSSTAQIVTISHGSIIGWLERIIISLGDTDEERKHVANGEIREYTLHRRDLEKLKRHKMVDYYCAEANNKPLIKLYRSQFIKLANLYDDPELDIYTIKQLLIGLFVSKISPEQQQINTELLNQHDVIAVCALHNSNILIDKFIDHYVEIGVKNFVFIDNNSDDDSILTIKQKVRSEINVDIWQTKDRFDGFKAMGWKQRMFAYYGLNRWYFNLDIDEFAVFDGSEKRDITTLLQYATNCNLKTVGGMLIDMYSSKRILENNFDGNKSLKEYRYFDMNTYRTQMSDKFKTRIYGGPRMRLFDRHPSLQKFPLAYVDKETLAINPHFWFPYFVNMKSEPLIGLLHYKFLPGDIKKYVNYIKSGVHWDNSSQYKSYVNYLKINPDASFYNNDYTAEYLSSKSLQKIVDQDNCRIIFDVRPFSQRATKMQELK